MDNLKSIIKTQVFSLLDQHINYDTTGSDYIENVSEELGIDVVEKPQRTVPLDMELYKGFVNQLTDHIMSGIERK